MAAQGAQRGGKRSGRSRSPGRHAPMARPVLSARTGAGCLRSADVSARCALVRFAARSSCCRGHFLCVVSGIEVVPRARVDSGVRECTGMRLWAFPVSCVDVSAPSFRRRCAAAFDVRALPVGVWPCANMVAKRTRGSFFCGRAGASVRFRIAKFGRYASSNWRRSLPPVRRADRRGSQCESNALLVACARRLRARSVVQAKQVAAATVHVALDDVRPHAAKSHVRAWAPTSSRCACPSCGLVARASACVRMCDEACLRKDWACPLRGTM